jgi:hypothetical protein
MNRRTRSLFAAVSLGLASLVACSADETTVTEPTTPSTPTTPNTPGAVVTSVSLSPGSASIAAGTTRTITATIKDQNGAAMSGQTVAWSSSNAAVATVSNGVVTGVSAGTATITATAANKSGTASITVTAASSTPPSGSSGTLLFSESFENSSFSGRGWYDNTSPSLSTTEHMPGSVSSLQWHWTVGATDPVNGGAMRHKFTASNSFYLSYYVKYSANYIGSGQDYHPHEFHALSNLDDDYAGPSDTYMTLYVEQNYQNGGKPYIAMQDNKSINTSYGSLPRSLIGVTENRSVGGCNGVTETGMEPACFSFSTSSGWYNAKGLRGPVVFNNTPGSAGYKNNWNYVEAYFQMNSIVNGVSQADGVMQYWFNGQLIIDRHDIVFRTAAHANLMFNKFVISPYIGDGSPVDQYTWIDNLRVATARIP